MFSKALYQAPKQLLLSYHFSAHSATQITRPVYLFYLCSKMHPQAFAPGFCSKSVCQPKDFKGEYKCQLFSAQVLYILSSSIQRGIKIKWESNLLFWWTKVFLFSKAHVLGIPRRVKSAFWFAVFIFLSKATKI